MEGQLMRLNVVGIGFAILLMGAVIFALTVVKVPHTTIETIKTTRTISLVPFTEYSVPRGSYRAIYSNLDGGVTWDIWVSTALPLDFYIMDKENFDKWVSGQKSNAQIIATNIQVQYSASWAVPNSGTWYFVFNDRNPIFMDKVVGLTVSRTYPDTEVQYVTVEAPLLPSDYANFTAIVMVIGVLLAGCGFVIDERSTPVKQHQLALSSRPLRIYRRVRHHLGGLAS